MKHAKLSFLIALWCLLGAASLGVLLLGCAPRGARPSLRENRMLAGFPELTGESVRTGRFMSGFEDWLSDGFFARDRVVAFAEGLTGLLDRRTEEERQAAEDARIDRLLQDDAGAGEYFDMDEDEAEDWSLADWLIPAAAAEPAGDFSLVIHAAGKPDKTIYTYPPENLVSFAGTLNKLHAMLPEGGEVHYLQPPVASVGRRVMAAKPGSTSWESTMEDALQSLVDDGVYIYNVPAILNDALTRGERCYFMTDHHWTELGAWYCAAAIAERRGYPALPYDEAAYDGRRIGSENGWEDRMYLARPLLPTHSYVLTHLSEETELPFMNLKVRSYTAYINNTRTPWRRFVSGFGSSRRALLLSDSFGNAFLPYLLPYYGEVHMTDLRKSYYDPEEAGGTFRELLTYHRIDDLYIVLSTSNGINSANSLSALPRQISE